MSEQEKYFADNYEIIFDEPLIGGKKVLEPDRPNGQQCRFCNRTGPVVTFRKEAHAIPELLGNKSLISPNECDSCNTMFGESYEHSLGIATLFERAVCGMKKKKGQPNYEDSSLSIEWANGRQAIVITDPDLFNQATNNDGPLSFTVSRSAKTLPFVPIDVAKAFVKIACSICPPDLVPTLERPIAWLANQAKASMTYYPVFTSFTTGENPYGDGRALLLKRTGRQQLPFLWCIVASRNHRFQFFVPFCSEDDHWTESGTYQFQAFHYPSWLEESTEFDVMNLASELEMQRNFDAKIAILSEELA